MPVLDNPKHEAFCQAYIKHHNNATEAYKQAGYSAEGDSIKANASRLLTNVNVKERIEELRKETEEEDLVTRKEVIEALKRIGKTAEAGDQLAVARSCWQDLGKAIGTFTDKKEVTGANGGPIEQKQITYSVIDTDQD